MTLEIKEVLAIAAALIAVGGNVPYVRKIFLREVQPHAYTWFVWSIVSGITLFGQLAKGAGVGAISTAASEFFTLSIFLLSLRYGFNGIHRTDTIFLLIALAGLVPWYLTKDPTISVVIAVSIDLAAFVPTIRKTWSEPATEAPVLYGANVVRHMFGLFSLQAYNVATVLHPAAMICVNTLMTALICMRRRA